jgi:phage protein D
MPVGLPQSASIKVNGSLLADELYAELIEVRVEQVVSAANRASIRFSDEHFTMLDAKKFKIGIDLDIAFNDDTGAPKSVFSGEITVITMEQGSSARHELVVEAFDKSHRLARGNKATTMLKVSYADAIKQLAGEFGMTADVPAVLNTPVHEYLIVSGTVLDFFNEIAMLTGTYWSVEKNKIIFVERSTGQATKVLKFGETLTKFKARFSEVGHSQSVSVRGWDYSTKQPVVSTNSAELSNPTGGSSLDTVSTMRAAYSGGDLLIGGTGASTQAEADKIAAGLGRRQSMGEMTARGELVGDPGIVAGMTITVGNVGSTLAGTYYLTSVDHIFGVGDLVTRFTAGGIDNSSIVDLLGRRSGGSAQQWAKAGIVVGIITNNKDPDEMGRVKVRFPTLSDSDESTWARLVNPGGGAARGLHFTPEINDEVLVVFEHGDVRRPMVLGGLWNGKDKPVETGATALSNGKVVEWAVQTTSKQKLVFHDGDQPGDKYVSIALANGTKLHLGEDKIQLIAGPADKPLEIKVGEASITMSNGDITIKGKNITLDATAKVTVKAANGIDIKTAGGPLAAEGMTVKIKSSTTLDVEAGAVASVKGAMVKIN